MALRGATVLIRLTPWERRLAILDLKVPIVGRMGQTFFYLLSALFGFVTGIVYAPFLSDRLQHKG